MGSGGGCCCCNCSRFGSALTRVAAYNRDDTTVRLGCENFDDKPRTDLRTRLFLLLGCVSITIREITRLGTTSTIIATRIVHSGVGLRLLDWCRRGHVRRVEALLDQVFTFWLRNKGLQLGCGKRIHVASLRCNQEQNLSARKRRKLECLLNTKIRTQ
jgi:hypothetical protein